MRDDDNDPYPYDDEEDADDSNTCQVCGVDIFTEEHDWDCPYADEDDEDDVS